MIRIKPFISSFIVAAFVIALINLPIFADGIPLRDKALIEEPRIGASYNIQTLEPLILGIANILLVAAGLTMFVCTGWSGIQWLAAGDPNNTQIARDRLTNCVLGLAIVALAFAIQIIIQAFFGITIFPT